jgi:hypothetical protein
VQPADELLSAPFTHLFIWLALRLGLDNRSKRIWFEPRQSGIERASERRALLVPHPMPRERWRW